jgi:hypothetical protein
MDLQCGVARGLGRSEQILPGVPARVIKYLVQQGCENLTEVSPRRNTQTLQIIAINRQIFQLQRHLARDLRL